MVEQKTMFYEQAEFDIRCEWGMSGVKKLSSISDIVIIVDVMSFSTCVDIAVSNGASVIPYRWKDNTAVEFAINRMSS
jgi:2-phosphosulfolactate phosphatase